MTDEIDLGPWPVPNHEPALRGYSVMLHLEPLPDTTGVRVVLEARKGAANRGAAARYYKVVEEQPYDAILMRDGNTAFYQVQNRLIDQVVAAITEYDAANPPAVVEP